MCGELCAYIWTDYMVVKYEVCRIRWSSEYLECNCITGMWHSGPGFLTIEREPNASAER